VKLARETPAASILAPADRPRPDEEKAGETTMTNKDARAELNRLRNLCAELYQVAGTLGADARVLDNLWAAADGKPTHAGPQAQARP